MGPLRAALLIAVLTFKPLFAQSHLPAQNAALLQAGLVVTADEFILPAYRDWADSGQTLATALGDYCAGTGDLAQARAAFADTFLAWQRASIVQLGPVTDLGGPFVVHLWPDKKSYSSRAVRAALLARDPVLLTDGALAERSIALSNLGALEIVLFDGPKPGTYDCDLARAIASHQAALADQMQTAWEPGAPFRTEFDTAATGHARFRDTDMLIREFLGGVVVYVDRLRKFKIQRGLGAAAGATRPERTEAKLSALGLASIQTSFQALADIYAVPFGFFDVTPDLGAPMAYYMLGETAANSANALAFEDRSLTAIAAEDGAMAQTIRDFGDFTLSHETYLKTALPGALGMVAGFTSADGD